MERKRLDLENTITEQVELRLREELSKKESEAAAELAMLKAQLAGLRSPEPDAIAAERASVRASVSR